ncbi:MAG: hypothetical protein JWO38_2470 [Gemmataceae bacterium]|nr:hypothetical protein [Gemmataceae bacterium]
MKTVKPLVETSIGSSSSRRFWSLILWPSSITRRFSVFDSFDVVGARENLNSSAWRRSERYARIVWVLFSRSSRPYRFLRCRIDFLRRSTSVFACSPFGLRGRIGDKLRVTSPGTGIVMSRTMLALFLMVAGSASADEGRPVKILNRGPWPHLPTHTGAGVGTDPAPITRVIRTEAELAKAAGSGARITAAKAFKLDAIDFDKYMIVAVEDGTQPMVGVSGGGPPSAPYTVSIVRIDRDDKMLTVRWRRLPRDKDQVLTRPLEAVLVGRFDAEVKFDRLPDPPAKPEAPAAAGKDVAPAGRASWPDGWPPEAPQKEWAVRSEDELIDPRLRAPEPVLEKMRAEAKARYAKALKVADIDFTKQMVVGVSGGVQPAAAGIEVTRAETDAAGKVLTVYWKLHPAAKDKPMAGIAHPAEVVLLDRFAGDIRFKEEPK